MNKKRLLMIFAGLIFFCSCLTAIGLWISTTSLFILPPEVAEVDRPSISPSGKFELSVIETIDSTGSRALKFQIRNLDSNSLFVSDDVFSARHTTFFLWHDNDQVWVYSGDIGTYFWTLDSEDTRWIKSDYKSTTPAPTFLRGHLKIPA